MGRVVRFIALVGVITLMAATPAIAQTDPTDSTSTTEATTTTTTTPPAGDTTTTTLPDPGTDGDAPPESVPDVPLTVPPLDPPVSGVAPLPGRVVTVDLRGARASAVARQAAYADAVAHTAQLQQDLSALQDKVGQLAATARQAVLDLADAREALTARAVDAYVRGNGFDTLPLDPTVTDGADSQRAALLGVVVDQDRTAVNRVHDLQQKVTSDQALTAKQLTDTQSQLDQANVDEAQALLNLSDAKLDLAVSSAGGNVVIHGFVFPVASPHTFSEDFGDPRLPGTPQAHFHQGCDIVAAEGTELYAAERGVITQINSSSLGGNGLWIKGESGTSYYYAHLSAYVPGEKVGQIVTGGDLVGYVGHTGDAYGPHLHFEVHPGGGIAVDPYPILLAADSQNKTP